MNAADMTGQRFGWWTVLAHAGNNRHRKAMWLRRCDCGTERLAERYEAGQHRVPEHTLTILVVPGGVCAMLDQDGGPKAGRKFAASSALEMRLPQTNDPQQGARLVRAFLRIADPRVRLAIVQMVERMGYAPADC